MDIYIYISSHSLSLIPWTAKLLHFSSTFLNNYHIFSHYADILSDLKILASYIVYFGGLSRYFDALSHYFSSGAVFVLTPSYKSPSFQLNYSLLWLSCSFLANELVFPQIFTSTRRLIVSTPRPHYVSGVALCYVNISYSVSHYFELSRCFSSLLYLVIST